MTHAANVHNIPGQRRRVVMRQSWRDLLFIHWPYDRAMVAARLPEGLTVDTYNGVAYIGIVVFRMFDVAFRPLPAAPGLSALNEINLRTYVRDRHGRPGIYFYSLDATLRPAVWTARRFYHLPYEHAEISYRGDRGEGTRRYVLRRLGDTEPAAAFVYGAEATLAEATPGSLDEFLVERYSFFTPHRRNKRIIRGSIYHEPYQIRHAELFEWSTRLFALNNFAEPTEPPCHVVESPGVDVSIFPLERV